jgi:cation transport regulator ChaC
VSDASTKFTRRSTLAMMGAAGLAAASRAAAESPPSTPQKYIFGYGSLIQIASRTRTVPKAFAAAPAIVKGISRGWYYQAESASWNPTYLGAVVDQDASTNGVIYPVTDDELAATDARESDYTRTAFPRSLITILDGSPAPPEGEYYFYASKSKKMANEKHPIVQSYVDICIDGCLEVEAMYPLARQAEFGKRFIQTCTDWKTPWINDRIFPYRPFIHVPRAFKIDELLRDYLPGGLFDNIKMG